MTEITGNNITYTGSMIFNDSSNTMLIRIPTEDSYDTFESTYDILSYSYGIDEYTIGRTFILCIKNESDFVIYIDPNDLIMESDSITPRTTTTYIFTKITETTVKVTKTSTGTEKNSVGTFLKDINVYGNVFDYKSVASISATAGVTYTTGQIFGGYIKRILASSYTDLLPTAANVVAAIKYPKQGTSFHCYIQNASSSNFNLTINGNTRMTVSGVDNIFSRSTTTLLLFTITNINPGSEAVTCYIMGVLSSADRGNAALITNVTASSYAVLTTDSTLNVDTNTIQTLCTITLPLISSAGQKRYFITDSTGKAGLYNIRVVPSGSDTIVGTSSVTINSNYSSISMYNNEVNNWILY